MGDVDREGTARFQIADAAAKPGAMDQGDERGPRQAEFGNISIQVNHRRPAVSQTMANRGSGEFQQNSAVFRA
jgi:hypothetical protein